MALSRSFAFIAWIPPALWMAGRVYVASFDGWGAWAAAPILLVPLVVSFILGIVVTGGYLALQRSEKQSLRSIGVLILPWIPILHVLIENAWRSAVGS